MYDLMKLQNGSDIRGVALPGVPGEEVNLDDYTVVRIAEAFVFWLSLQNGKAVFDMNICIGQDSRLSGDELKEALMRGVCAMGARCSDAGLASTPAMFMSTVMPYYEFDGAIMITASHLPWNRNGFKFFTPKGGLNKEDITYILNKAKKLHPIMDVYECDSVNLMQMYAAHLRMLLTEKAGGNLKGMKIAVDAGNGAGGFFANEVLAKLGADVSASQFLDPDGHFPNHEPNPENKDAMAAISRRVLETGADLGIIFDTDVDRSAAVLPDGTTIDRNRIIALAAAIGSADHPGGTVVTDSITSNELHQFLESSLGLKHLRYRRGYRNVINKAIELTEGGEDAFLAIETSGHAAFSDNYYLDDGAYLAVLVIAEAARLKKEGRNLGERIQELREPAEAREVRFSLTGADFSGIADSILEKTAEWAGREDGLSLEEPNYEGVRVNFTLPEGSGWFLLRKSLHDPVMPLNIEADTEGAIDAIFPKIRAFLTGLNGIEA